MFYSKLNIFCLIFIFCEIRFLSADEVSNTSSNQGDSPSSVQPRFFDLGSMGFPNFGSGGIGNPTSNYPVNSFFPYGNQNNNVNQQPQPQPQPGLGIQNQPSNQGNYPQGYYPNQQGFPYQGDSMNPSPNYNVNQVSPWNRPNQGGYPERPGYTYGGAELNTPNPQYNLPPQYNQVPYPGNVNSGIPPNQYNNYNPSLPGQGNQGIISRPGQMDLNFQPDDISNFQNPNVQYPDRPYENQPNLYYSQPRPSQNYPYGGYPYGVQQPGYLQPNPVNNVLDSNIRFPTDAPPLDIGQPTQYPGTTNLAPMNPDGPLNLGNINNDQPLSPDNPGVNRVGNEAAAILGKPVVVPSTTVLPSQVIFDNSSENPTQKKCVQDCQSTSEYNPVCGSNNVTYINPGKFICARNCGEAVYVQNNGKCADDV